MPEFTLVKRGYNSKEVDEYIERNNAYLEDKLKEQRLRINELKAQNLKLAAKIREMRAKEDDVKNALIAANEKAKEILSAAKIRYAYEGQRLKLLQTKWTNYFESSMKKSENDDYKKNEAYYIKVETEIQEILKSDFGISSDKPQSVNDEIMAQYKSETKRLFNCGDERDAYGEIIKNIKKEFAKELPSAAEADGDFTDITGDGDCGLQEAVGAKGAELPREAGSGQAARTERQRYLGSSVSSRQVVESGDYRNLASVKPEQSLEELCKELGL